MMALLRIAGDVGDGSYATFVRIRSGKFNMATARWASAASESEKGISVPATLD